MHKGLSMLKHAQTISTQNCFATSGTELRSLKHARTYMDIAAGTCISAWTCNMHILLNSKSESDSLSNPTQVQFSLQTLTSISSTQSHLRISMFQPFTRWDTVLHLLFVPYFVWPMKWQDLSVNCTESIRDPWIPTQNSPQLLRGVGAGNLPGIRNTCPETGMQKAILCQSNRWRNKKFYKLYKLQPHFLVVFVINSGAVSEDGTGIRWSVTHWALAIGYRAP